MKSSSSSYQPKREGTREDRMLHALEYIAHALSFLIKGSRGPTRRRQRRPPHLAQASIACSAINFSRVGSRSPALAAAMMRFANAERIVPASSGFVSSIAWVANQASPKTLQSTKRLGIVRRSGKHRTALHNSWKASALRFGGGCALARRRRHVRGSRLRRPNTIILPTQTVSLMKSAR